MPKFALHLALLPLTPSPFDFHFQLPDEQTDGTTPSSPTQPPYRITYELLLAGIRAIVPATLCSLGVGIS